MAEEKKKTIEEYKIENGMLLEKIAKLEKKSTGKGGPIRVSEIVARAEARKEAEKTEKPKKKVAK